MSYFSQLNQEQQETTSVPSAFSDDAFGNESRAEDPPTAFTEDDFFAVAAPAPASPSAHIDEEKPDSASENKAATEASVQHEADKGSKSQDTTADTPKEAGADNAEKKNDTDDENEDKARKAHEEAEAKRKAEWDAKQLKKKRAEEESLQRLQTLSRQELLKESTKRVRDDTEKLTRRNMKECVCEYIQTKCVEDPEFAKLVLHPKKNMVRCFQFINRKAQDYVQDEMKANGIKVGPGMGVQIYSADIPDGMCYQWAEEYFRDPNAKEDQEKEETFKPAPYQGKSKVPAKTKTAPKPKGKEKPKPVEKKPPAPKPVENEQITLGDLGMFGKAG